MSYETIVFSFEKTDRDFWDTDSKCLYDAGLLFASKEIAEHLNLENEEEEIYMLSSKCFSNFEVRCVCGDITNLYDDYCSLHVDDYVSHPMIVCDKCDRESFLCLSCKPISYEKDNFIFFEYHLLTIAGVRNVDICRYKWNAKNFDLCLKRLNELHQSNTPWKVIENEMALLGVDPVTDEDDFDDLKFYEQNPNFEIACYNKDKQQDNLIGLKSIDDDEVNTDHDGVYLYCRLFCPKSQTTTFVSCCGD